MRQQSQVDETTTAADAPLLPAGTRTLSTELLGLCSPRVRNQKTSVVRDQLLLELHGAEGVDVLGVVRNDGLGDGLADGVYLGSVSTTLDADTDVDGGKAVLTRDEDGLVDLEAEDLRLEEVDGGAVDVDEATALLGVGDRGRGLAMRPRVQLPPSAKAGFCIPSFCRKSERPSRLMP